MDDKEPDVFLVLTGVEVFRAVNDNELQLVRHKSKCYNKIIECVL